jgi:hypothetical protein
MNVELKIAIIRRFGSQIRAAKPLQVDEPRLSRLVNGHVEPTAQERQRFTTALGVDYFAADANPVRAEELRAS